ncbi:hypothetical protein [Nocardia sp. NPDC005998]|uniref:hypothetical protein n=1 Tax=Nocardia sp. NPDC005998 TaxID=3156894 RepID=UPI0033A29DBA
MITSITLLLDDIELDAPDPYLDITGTLVEAKGKGTGGWVRKTAPKTDNSWRRILLPSYTIEAIREAIEHLKTSGSRIRWGCCSRRE